MKKILDEMEADVIDITGTAFTYTNTNDVPNLDDSSLTFGNGDEKKAKTIKTCVLFVDIRNSVALTKKHHTKTMTRVYSAFTKGVLKAAKKHNGMIRNIIGDRVMIVFPSKNCFTNAIDCAVTINHLSKFIINKKFRDVDFKCGIGIDYGELKVTKVGIAKLGTERIENRGLVWVGYPANLASRLTDIANKTVDETYYEVTHRAFNFGGILPFLGSEPSGFLAGFGASNIDKKPPTISPNSSILKMSPEEFASSIHTKKDGSITVLTGGIFEKFEKKTDKTKYPPILVTSSVFFGFKLENPQRGSIKNGLWRKQKRKVKDIQEDVYGADLHWII